MLLIKFGLLVVGITIIIFSAVLMDEVEQLEEQDRTVSVLQFPLAMFMFIGIMIGACGLTL